MELKAGVDDALVKGCLDEGSTPSGSTEKLANQDVGGVTKDGNLI